MLFTNLQLKFFFRQKFLFAINFRISESTHLGKKAQEGRPQVRPKLYQCAVKFQKNVRLTISSAGSLPQVRRRFPSPPPPLTRHGARHKA